MPVPPGRTAEVYRLTPSQVWIARTHWNVFGQSTPGVPTHGLTLTLRVQTGPGYVKLSGSGSGSPPPCCAAGASCCGAAAAEKKDGIRTRTIIRSKNRLILHHSFEPG